MKRPSTMTRDELAAEFERSQEKRFETGLDAKEKRRSDMVWRELHNRVLASILSTSNTEVT